MFALAPTLLMAAAAPAPLSGAVTSAVCLQEYGKGVKSESGDCGCKTVYSLKYTIRAIIVQPGCVDDVAVKSRANGRASSFWALDAERVGTGWIIQLRTPSIGLRVKGARNPPIKC